MERIVDKFIDELQVQLAAQKVTISLAPAARAWLAEKGYDELFGARPLSRLIQSSIRLPLANEILFGKLAGGGAVAVGVADGALSFDYSR